MGDPIRNHILYAIFPGQWDSWTNIASRVDYPIEAVQEAINALVHEGLLQSEDAEGQMRLALSRTASSDDEYLVWVVRTSLKQEFGRMPSPEQATRFLETRAWSVGEGRTVQHIFKALAAHLRQATGHQLTITDWDAATLAIAEMELLA